MIRRLAASALVLALGASVGGDAAAASEGTLAIELCGRLIEHAPATANATGRLTIGTRSYVIATGTVGGNAGVTVGIGRDLCVEASAGRTSSQLVRYLFFPMPAAPICGTALANAGTTVNMRADFGLVRIVREGDLREPRPGERICYLTAVSSAGDVVAVREDPVDTTNEREWVAHCGTVRMYRPATASGDGAITVGSETYPIALGVAYTGDPAGDRTDRTTVGQNMCVRGVRGPTTALIEYLTTAMAATITGRVFEYVPPTDGTPGIATLSFRTQLRIRIPAAIDATADIARSDLCYAVGVSGSGDMSATAVVPCEPGRVTGPGATTASPAIAASSPAATPSPTVAAASPSPILPTPKPTGVVASSTEAPRQPGADGPATTTLLAAAAGLALIGALAAVAYWRARARGA